MVHLQAQTHTDELEQPNQLYLKEVGSLNAGAPAHLSMCARVPPYPVRVGPGIPPRRGARLFIAPAHVPCDIRMMSQHNVTMRTRHNDLT